MQPLQLAELAAPKTALLEQYFSEPASDELLELYNAFYCSFFVLPPE
jgi:hypothetical protein